MCQRLVPLRGQYTRACVMHARTYILLVLIDLVVTADRRVKTGAMDLRSASSVSTGSRDISRVYVCARDITFVFSPGCKFHALFPSFFGIYVFQPRNWLRWHGAPDHGASFVCLCFKFVLPTRFAVFLTSCSHTS